MKPIRPNKLSHLSIVQFQLLIIASLTIIKLHVQCKQHDRSGFYYDNGENQTVAHQFNSPKERRALAKNILKLLDLPIRSTRSITEMQLDIPASHFIRDVYMSASGKQEVGSFKFTEAELKTIEDSEVIISYSAFSKFEKNTTITLEFDMSETPKFSSALNSELRLYVKPSTASLLIISLFDSYGLVDSIKVNKEGWIKLSTEKVMRRWLNCPDCKRELHLSMVSVENDISDNEILTFDDPQKQPFLVGYFVNIRSVRSTQFTVPYVRIDRTTVPKSYNLNNPYTSVKDSRRPKTNCNFRSLYVRFRDMDFDKFIVQPDGYEAGYCHGDCRFPLTSHMNATNHALVQSYVNLVQPHLAPRVACAPKEYGDLRVFYAKGHNKFVYKVYHKMIVKSCGCC